MLRSCLFIIALFVTPALADPVTVGVTLLSAAGTATALGVHFLTALAITVGLSYAARQLAPDMDDFDNAEIGYMISGTAAAADHQIIYGRQRVGGVVVYKETTNDNTDLHVLIALAGHEVEEIEAIYANDEELTFASPLSTTLTAVTAPNKYAEQSHEETTRQGGQTVTETVIDQPTAIYAAAFNGSDDQTASGELITASNGQWTSEHRLRGIAYIYVKLVFAPEAFPNGEPNFTAVVKGKKVYNPNTATTAYSDNVALCLRDYLTSDYGVGADADEIDDTSFGVAANVCDEDVALLAGSTEKNYALNASFTTGTEPQKIIDNLVKSMAGSLWYSQGKFRCKAGKYTTPYINLTEDDLRGNLGIQTRRSRREGFNTVRGIFRGPETNWIKTDYPQITSATFKTADGGEEVSSNLDLPYTPTNTMAQRIAKILLYRNREQLVVSAAFGLRAFQVQVGDIVTLTNTRAGWSVKPFEVVGWSFEPSMDEVGVNVSLVLSEVSQSVYDWNSDENDFEVNNTNLESAFFVPQLGLSLTTATRVINEHVITVLQATTTATASQYVDYAIVEYRKTVDSDYIQMGKGELGIFEAIDVENGEYQVRCQAVNAFGVKGVYTIGSINVQALIESPENVVGLSASVSGGFTTLEWQPVSDLDLSYYRIRHAIEETGASYADATDSVIKVARPATSVVVPARTGSYMIRAFDKLGIPSSDFTTTVVTDGQLEDFTNTTTVSEHSSFSGTKTGCSVSSSKLRITDPSSAPTTATYVFNNEIDTSAVRRVRATGKVKVARLDTTAALWDNLAGNIDLLSGLWDDLTANSQEADTNVLFYLRHTDSDPSGTPTWSEWKPFKSGDFSARAFQFKIELESTADNVTPNIEQLSATVEYN